MPLKTLDQLNPGEKAIIQNIKSDSLTIKLLEMGLLPGREVKFNHRAPFGDPVSIKISNYNLTLRIDEASLIEVK